MNKVISMETMKKISVIEEGIYKVNSVFSFHQKVHAEHFLTGLIVDPKASILRISQLYGEKNHTNLNRFFTEDWWSEEKLDETRIIEFINKSEAYVLVSDDTDNLKTGKKIKGVSVFKKHDASGFEKAHCKVLTGIVNQAGEYIPLFSTIYLKEEDAKRYGIEFKSKLEIVREHSKKAKALGLVIYVHIYDSWYFNADMMEFSKDNEWIVSQLSGKYNLFIDGKKIKSTDFKNSIDKRKMKVLRVHEKRIRFLELIVKLSNNESVKIVPFIDEDSKRIKILVSTNLNWSAKRIFQEYSKRQKIETFIRDLKQELHLGSCSSRELKSHAKWDSLVLLAYTILKLFIKTNDAMKKGISTIGKAVDFIREKIKLNSLFIKCKT